ncbi:MAG: transglutaminase-like cysteine peptidase [Alphaproteobacteria bacterium]|nr:transglutaminase-like cysteine peptidase [Alphaproteobacteria bacterium]
MNCTESWMVIWLQGHRAAAGLDRDRPLQAVNRFFDRWPYKTDRATYRASEYWAPPDEFMANSGDCEDYAIAKDGALRELGFSNQELRIAVVYDKLRRIGHAVLADNTEGDIPILNNRTDVIASHLRYNSFVPRYLEHYPTPARVRPRLFFRCQSRSKSVSVKSDCETVLLVYPYPGA